MPMVNTFVIFTCDAWHEERRRVEYFLECPFTPEMMVPKMLGCQENWDAVAKFIDDVMKSKEKEERRRQRIT